MLTIGVMSGTSCDGVDAVLLQLSSPRRRHTPTVLAHRFVSYPAGLREELFALIAQAPSIARVAQLHFELAAIYARCVRALPGYEKAVVCGMHGQTVWHCPPVPRGQAKARATPCTLQLGSSALLAQRVGLPVVGDFRGADVALGGQGAPIVPFAHWFFSPARECPRLIVNLGGICNMTFVGRTLDQVHAYDVGAGMMLSDAYAQTALGHKCDRGGKLSRGGKLIPRLLEEVLAHPFHARKPPKSTGREEFGAGFFLPLFRRYARFPQRDVAYTLLAATATALHRTVEGDGRMSGLRNVVLSGGGARNPTLERLVREAFGPIPVNVSNNGVFAPQCHEAAAMALLAARTLHRLPSSVPGVTGASRAAILGHVHFPS